MSNSQQDIGLRFQKALFAAGFKRRQSAFADEIGVTPALISDVIAGRAKPNLEMLRHLEERYNISMRWIMTGQGDMWLAPEEKAKRINLNRIDDMVTFSYNGLEITAEELRATLEQVWILQGLGKRDWGEVDGQIDTSGSSGHPQGEGDGES